jgi:PAS domain S-box-containing protein
MEVVPENSTVDEIGLLPRQLNARKIRQDGVFTRDRVAEKLPQDEIELRQITDAIPQTISVLAPDGTALYANQVALNETGLTLEEVNAHGFLTRAFHPDDVDRVRAERLTGLLRGTPNRKRVPANLFKINRPGETPVVKGLHTRKIRLACSIPGSAISASGRSSLQPTSLT